MSWSQAFSLSNAAFLKSVGHVAIIKMYIKKILMAKGQHYIQNLLIHPGR